TIASHALGTVATPIATPPFVSKCQWNANETSAPCRRPRRLRRTGATPASRPHKIAGVRLAYWFPLNTFSAWSISPGAVDALRRMGHEVLACPCPIGAKTVNPDDFPSVARLNEMDGIILSGPEHIEPFLIALYADWRQIRAPKAAWLHETVQREDYGMLDLDAVKRRADVIFCPAVQDEAYGLRYLPFGVDTLVFTPQPVVARDME